MIDGSGRARFRADVGIAGDRIAAVEPIVEEPGRRTIEADGLVVCPGFTQFAGWNDDPPGFDWSWRTIGEYLDRLDEGIAVNACTLVPHGTVRMCAIGMDDRPPTDAELARMKRLLVEGLDQGAVGFSAGLTYTPGMYAEVVLIDAARADGIDITLDTYPYLVGATYLHAFLPSWMHVGGSEATLERLRDLELRERLRVELEEDGSDDFHGVPIDWGTIVVGGRRVAGAAAEAEARPIDYFCDLLVEAELGVACIAHTGNEENVRTIMTHPAHTVGSDGILVREQPHPRSCGTFPRYFAVYVRELGILTWEEAVRKMTSLPAQRLGLPDRGLLRPAAAADVVRLDPEGVRDAATYEEPRQLPDGIPFVLVNGRFVVDDGRRTDELPGGALRRRDRRTTRPRPRRFGGAAR